MKKIFFLTLLTLISVFNLTAQENSKQIKDYLNKEILLDNGFAGESITLIKEDNKYLIIRKIFGSGLPIAGIIKYSVKFNSESQIEFSEVINSEKTNNTTNKELFKMNANNNGVSIYLNGLKLQTK